MHKGTGLSIYFVLFLFALKVAAGCANLYVHYHEFLTNDIRFYHEQSIIELNGFSKNPQAFLNEWLFNWGDYRNRYNIIDKDNMRHWSDLGVLIHTKFMNLANIFTLGHLYANVIFFNVIYFLGFLQLYKVFYQLQPHKKWLLVGSIFFIPSTLFWCSGIHKDGWVLAAIGFVTYFTMVYINTKALKYWIGILLSLFLLFVSRYFVFLCFFPPFILWVLFYQYPKRQFIFIGSYVFVLILFFTVGYFSSIDPMGIIVEKQRAFFLTRGYSDMKTPILSAHFSSFIQNLPTALNHILLQPAWSKNNILKYQIASLDSWLVFILIITMLFYVKRNHLDVLFYLMILFFAISMYLFIGYTIPNCGALVRYKSGFTALLLPVLVSISEVPFFKRFYTSVL